MDDDLKVYIALMASAIALIVLVLCLQPGPPLCPAGATATYVRGWHCVVPPLGK
jgi:hypothetical protein